MGTTSYSFLNSVVALPIVITIDLSLLLHKLYVQKQLGKINIYLSNMVHGFSETITIQVLMKH